MNAHRRVWILMVVSAAAAMTSTVCRGQVAAALPPGVTAVWDLNQADRQTTPTREQICLNGLWRWQPADPRSDRVPDTDWGYFKVPGAWPGITDYMQKDCQTVHPHPSWRDVDLAGVKAAWYQREISVPAAGAGRRLAVRAEYLNSYAAVYLDGKRAGQIEFPGGELEITSFCRPGGTHLLSLLVVALPLKGVLLAHTDTNSARQVEGSVARRGLCGDVYLVATPAGPRLGDLKVDTSVRQEQIRPRDECRLSLRDRTRLSRSERQQHDSY